MYKDERASSKLQSEKERDESHLLLCIRDVCGKHRPAGVVYWRQLIDEDNINSSAREMVCRKELGLTTLDAMCTIACGKSCLYYVVLEIYRVGL